ncbi:excinuclease ABC subunit C [Candidatus Gottesmanbacteria bacterium RIFCSPHIGHO2_01_FULL_39_10]|uniref:Excinuclease ABC subunit C n=1 Tax=Candidatus Gottesmanbacteria bacterium RIFCSPHIGHO2_01_FULL_39_10 TaxID=1798375 RepID=A0A1F5ZKS2_9BACT|nr:MAG: excinuclease ABC subunit C [Candidatus Gottesmanbacteria bacterium RIFCSPHIGHO2_01_FULL_39_10]
MFYCYILLCIDNKTYIGATNDLKDRIMRYQKGYIDATKKRLPVKLISYFAFSNKYTAFNFEKYLKSGSGRAFLKKHDIIKI